MDVQHNIKKKTHLHHTVQTQLMHQVAKKREIAKSSPVETDSDGLTGK
jgi:hypothetical protein